MLKKLIQQIDTTVSGKNPFGRVKVIETLGQKLNETLSNKAPWKTEHCGRPQCPPCETKSGSCKQRNITYSVECLQEGCKHIYWGESHRTWHDRSQEHLNSLEKGDESNALAKHQKLHHPEQPPLFKFKVDRTWKTSLGRQIREAILIQGSDPDTLMNSRSEWGSYAIPRVVIENARPPDTQSSPGIHQNPDTKRKQNLPEDSQVAPNSKRNRTALAPPIVPPSSSIKKFLNPRPSPTPRLQSNGMASKIGIGRAQ